MGVEFDFTDLYKEIDEVTPLFMVQTANAFMRNVTRGGSSDSQFSSNNTPVNPAYTGRLRASWDINTTGATIDGGKGKGRDSIKKRVPKAPSPSDIGDELYITNGAPYIQYVEAGVNPWVGVTDKVKYNKGFIKRAIHKVFK